MRTWIGIVGVLIQETPFGILLGHFNSSGDRAIRAFFARSQNDFGSKNLKHLTAFNRHTGRHQNLDGVTLDLSNSCQGNTRISRRGLDNGLTRHESTVLLSVLNHGLGDAVFHRAKRILIFEFRNDAHVGVWRQSAHINEWGVTNEIKNTFVRNHGHLQNVCSRVNSLLSHSGL